MKNVVIDPDNNIIYCPDGEVSKDLFDTVKNMYIDDWSNLGLHPFPFEVHTHPQDPNEQYVQLLSPWVVRKLTAVTS